MVRAALLTACVIFSACAVVKIGKGDTNTIQHDGGAEEAYNLASRACSSRRSTECRNHLDGQ